MINRYILPYISFLESVDTKLNVDENAMKKIKIAVVNIINTLEFFATVLFSLNLVEDRNIKTMATDGISIAYNPDFVKGLSIDEIVFILCHECMHNILLHFIRRGNRNLIDIMTGHSIWNYAGDYAINLLLDGIGKRPEWVLYDKKYENLSTEEIYEMLISGKKIIKGSSVDVGNMGAGDRINGDVQETGSIQSRNDNTVYKGNSELSDNKNNESELEKLWNNIANQAAARQQGNLPSGMARFIGNIGKPVINWKTELKKFITNIYNKLTYKIPNRKYIHGRVYIPGVKRSSDDEFDNAVIAIDTSGSINQEELNLFATELNSIYKQLNINTSYVIWCDSKIGNIQKFGYNESFKIDKLKPVGGGGTSFIPPFEWINDNLIKKGKKPCFVLYFTDSYGEVPNRNLVVKYSDRILWIIIGGAEADNITPFHGKKIQLDGRLK